MIYSTNCAQLQWCHTVIQGLRDMHICIKLQQRYAPFVGWKEYDALPEKQQWTCVPSHFKYQNRCLCQLLLSIIHFANNLLKCIHCYSIIDNTCACAHDVLAQHDIRLYIKELCHCYGYLKGYINNALSL